MTVRTRLAPSPTGFLHIGTARTALFNYLFAKHHGGQFILRVEDTDVERSTKEFEKDILDGLSWLGMQWDEGPGVGGPYGPYHQSERIDIYEKYLRDLFDRGLLYNCYCTKDILEAEREVQILSRQAPRYNGKCRSLSEEECVAKKASGAPSTLRYKIEPKIFTVTDLIRGELTFDTAILDDFIVAKDFRTPLYNFAVVVDDYLMNITHVIRGEEHISNIPKQVIIDEALGFPVPQFAHLSLILNADRTKLSKRQNKVSLLEYREEGYLPEALINFISLLGWNPGGERELYVLDELAKLFDLEHIHKAGAIFDVRKLEWFNNHYIRERNIDDIVDLVVPILVRDGFIQLSADLWYTVVETGERIERDYLRAIIRLERERLKKLSEISEHTALFFKNVVTFDPSMLLWKTMTKEQAKESLTFSHAILSTLDSTEFTPSELEKLLKDALAGEGRANGEVLWPLRVALTGMKASPTPFEIASILGKEKTLQRITDAIALL
ncbi:MAG: glutamate--tRNA ligase [bacterium]|nr:glutamate--tRNA ligase [bacterium]